MANSASLRCVLASVTLSSLSFAQTLLELVPLPAPLVPVLETPTDVCTADLEGDGDDDLVLREGGNVVFLRRQGGVSTREVPPLGVVGSQAPVLASDLDGDGRVDLAVPAWPTPLLGEVRIWWGDGTGQFPTTAPANAALPPQTDARRFAAADVDGDGDADIVVASVNLAGAAGSLLLRNNGNRTFSVAPVGQFPNLASGVATPFLVDVDGDGARDVIFVSRDARTRLYWNNSGNFAEATTAQFPLLQQSLRGLAIADFDGDTDLDVVLGGDNQPGVLLRTTALRTLVLDPAPATDRFTLALTTLDEGGDGDVDVRAFRRDHDHLLRNDGTGAFAIAVRQAGNDPVQALALLDIDGDGDVDALRIGTAPAQGVTFPAAYVTTSIAWRAGDRYEYAGVNTMPASATVTGIPRGDIDGDGFGGDLPMHVAEPVGSGPAANTLQFASSDADGVLRYRWGYRTGGLDNGFFVDVSGDDRDEYVFFGEQVQVAYLPNTDGVLAETTVPLPAPTWAPTRAGTGADVDGDGDNDLVLVLRVSNYHLLRVLINNGGGQFVDETATRVVGPAAPGNYMNVFAADLDGDGDRDVWLHTDDVDYVFRNQNGVLTFVPAAVPINGWGWTVATLGDLDGDGDVDLYAGRNVMLNNGNATFAVHSNRLPNVLGADMLGEAADFDDDGDLDLVGGGNVMRNNGAAFFSLANNVLPPPPTPGSTWAVRFIDLDRDGDPDVLTALDNRPRVLRNRLRQFGIDGPAALGGTVNLVASAAQGSAPLPLFVGFVCSLATVPATFQPGLGWLQVDPTAASLIGPFALPPTGGQIQHQVPVPNVPALVGTLFAAQTLELRGTRFRLGNLVTTLLGR
ncbi:MAG TPA: VCBS repeat-containing protein [Planctomycetota bacterium]